MKQADLQISSTILDQQHLKIAVSLKNTPKDLFGIAFHLSFKNEQWQLLKSEKGQSLQQKNDQLFFLTNERKTPNHEIIFGTTLNNNNRTFFSDGEVVSYTLWAKNPQKLEGVLTDKILQTVAYETKNNTLPQSIKPQQTFVLSQPETTPAIELTPHYLLMKKAILPDHTLLLTYMIWAITFVVLVTIFLTSIHIHQKKLGPRS